MDDLIKHTQEEVGEIKSVDMGTILAEQQNTYFPAVGGQLRNGEDICTGSGPLSVPSGVSG